MHIIPTSPPVIHPLPDATDRPLWSVMIPTFNCGNYLRETLQSVLMQDPGPDLMQIEVVDDCSTKDDPEKIVQELGGGRVGFFRQPRNVGSLKNFETSLNRSKGYLIHQLHGDDSIRPGFYKKMGDLMETYPQAGAAFCRHAILDELGNLLRNSELERFEAGILPNWLHKISRQQLIQTPSMVVRRHVYERLGGFHSVKYGEDWEMWTRIAARYPVAFEPEVLANYRKHISGISSTAIRTGANIRDLRKVINIIQQYLPENDRKAAKHAAEEYYAKYAFKTARNLYGVYDDTSGAMAQLKEAVSLYHNNPIWLLRIFKFYMKIVLRRPY